jgi:hypothetical protein
MDEIYHAANVFVSHPERAWVIAAVFFAFFFVSRTLTRQRRSIRSWILLVPAVSWTIFGLLELLWKEYNIRIDLLVTWPAILGITTICCVWWSLSLLRLLKRAKTE